MPKTPLVFTVALLVAAVGCGKKEQKFDTNVEILQVKRFGKDPKAPTLMDLEVKFGDCPGDIRRVVRADKAFAECAQKLKAGDKVPAQVNFLWSSERSNYRSDFVSIAGCAMKIDPKEEANYEMVSVCEELKATGATVGVHCDKTRGPALVAKCPWMKRE